MQKNKDACCGKDLREEDMEREITPAEERALLGIPSFDMAQAEEGVWYGAQLFRTTLDEDGKYFTLEVVLDIHDGGSDCYVTDFHESSEFKILVSHNHKSYFWEFVQKHLRSFYSKACAGEWDGVLVGHMFGYSSGVRLEVLYRKTDDGKMVIQYIR